VTTLSQPGVSQQRVLIIGPAFFGYEQDILTEFRRQGHQADFLDERPSNGSVFRAVVRVRKSLLLRRIDAHFRAAAARLANSHYDLVLVIKGEVVPRWFLELLREKSPGARFKFYAYDALANSNQCLELLDMFDERFSFDRDDVERDDRFSYLPLFFTPEFAPNNGDVSTPARRHNLAFVGTLHSERYEIAKRLLADGADAFMFFYAQARWYFAATKYVSGENRSVPWRDVAFRPMSREAIAETFSQSKAVLDIQRSGQVGLTMRTFEVLASGAILVTTNPAVKREPFYDPERVIVVGPDWDAQRLERQLDHLQAPGGRPGDFDDYSLRAWVERISRLSG